jgi:hypothetical protein
MSTIYFNLDAQPNDRRSVAGSCANCGKDVYESLPILDDAYNDWAGRCPHCAAINFLSTTHGLRGYDSRHMYLVLPTEEEKAANNMPADCPTRNSFGPATMHGSPAVRWTSAYEPAPELLRRWQAVQRKYVSQAVRETGSASRARYLSRFTIHCLRIEQYRRQAEKFAVHVGRVHAEELKDAYAHYRVSGRNAA